MTPHGGAAGLEGQSAAANLAQGKARAFAFGVWLNLGYSVLEAVFGIVIGSMALVADAGHNLSDVLGLLLSWGALYLSRQEPTQRRTFGYSRATILASLFSALLLVVAMGGVAIEALHRYFESAPPPDGIVVLVVAFVGVGVNLFTAWMLLRTMRSDLNVRGAYLHMMADAYVSIGVMAAGYGIFLTGWAWLDPATSLLVVVFVLLSTWSLLKESVVLAMDSVPPGVEPAAVQAFLVDRPGVESCHDLHIWALSTTETALTVHLVMPGGHPGDEFLFDTVAALEQRFGIGHATLQIESGRGDRLCPERLQHAAVSNEHA